MTSEAQNLSREMILPAYLSRRVACRDVVLARRADTADKAATILRAYKAPGRPGLNRLNTKYEILNTRYERQARPIITIYAKQTQFPKNQNERNPC